MSSITLFGKNGLQGLQILHLVTFGYRATCSHMCTAPMSLSHLKDVTCCHISGIIPEKLFNAVQTVFRHLAAILIRHGRHIKTL